MLSSNMQLLSANYIIGVCAFLEPVVISIRKHSLHDPSFLAQFLLY
jgi:hypothetical protein